MIKTQTVLLSREREEMIGRHGANTDRLHTPR
jgi:hypothetical protein